MGEKKMKKNKKANIGLMILGGIVAIVLLIGLGYWVKYLLLPVKVMTSQIDSAGNIIDKTYDANNAIYNYEWFKTQYEKILANRLQVQNVITSINEFKQTYGNVSSWDFTTKEEYNRLNTIKVGLQNQENILVAEYNARSKMANRNIFMDKLPLSVDKMIW
jgi:hypothetical protein